jgi:hypothetical protein
VSHCPDCDQPTIWGGMSWHRHTDRQHAATRQRLTRYAARLLRERAAVLAGHRVTIRFTATVAWVECACGHTGPPQCDSAYARGDGHDHLAAVGSGVQQ